MSEWISESGSFLSRRTPFTSLRNTSFSAPSAWATAVAAVSALTFSRSPVSVSHIDGITGTWPGVAQVFDRVAIDPRHAADVAQVDRLAVVARRA